MSSSCCTGRAAELGDPEAVTVGAELLAYGRELQAVGAAQVGGSFTGNPEADELLADPNAFLLGVLFTQGIPAERAWAGPFQLRSRLGTLDVGYLATHPREVEAAVCSPPMLHRFKRTLPAWLVSASERLLTDYNGDASRIWAQGQCVADVVDRLVAFDGIGRKKALMTVQILVRHFGVELTGAEAGQVAYDIQVRRVFLRTGLVDHDDPASIEAAAARIIPESPGTLDLAAWLIGRDWCRPRQPRCDECRLSAACPRKTWLIPVGVGSKPGVRR